MKGRWATSNPLSFRYMVKLIVVTGAVQVTDPVALTVPGTCVDECG